jgi:type II secretory pathway pseudopilin PulG
MNKKRGVKQGQVWIETVIYTLIGLAIIALLISIVYPRINQMKDKAVLGQTIDSLNLINNKVIETLSSAGNTRVIELVVKKGQYIIDSPNDAVYYFMGDSNYLYSQLNQTVPVTKDIDALTLLSKGKYSVSLILNYSSYNITYNDKDIQKVLTPASGTYSLIVENKGDKKLNFKLTS